jgi:hypothetical protein
MNKKLNIYVPMSQIHSLTTTINKYLLLKFTMNKSSSLIRIKSYLGGQFYA